MIKNPVLGKKILVVDDHKNIRVSLRMALEAEGAEITEAADIANSSQLLGNPEQFLDAFPFDLVLLDIRLPDGSGLDLLKLISEGGQGSRVIMISGEGTLNDAYHATQMGAFDYIEKPFSPERLLVSVGRGLDFNKIRHDNLKLIEKVARGQLILGNSPKVKELLGTIKKVAPTNGRVLITGESGTGKELVAREIHRLSARSEKDLIKINCAAFPSSLIESELFGHEKGAFTGAVKARKGVFERAHDATLFMDEVGELEPGVQAKLLRVLQSGELSRVGSETPLKVDVRLIAATNRNLEDMVQSGDFREDLFYRLNVVSLHVPPLRERPEDIPLLAEAFLHESCEEHSLEEKTFDPETVGKLGNHSWPGNVRELKNYIERLVILSDGKLIDELEEFDSGVSVKTPTQAETATPSQEEEKVSGEFQFGSDILSWHDFHQSAGKSYIKYVLRKSGGNVSEAARMLCLERAYLHRLMRKLGVQRDVIVP